VPRKGSHVVLRKLGARLRALRKDRQLSQEALAHAANLERAYVSGVERGEFNVSVIALARLARVLHVPVRAFFDSE
jgi:transcriptional regulator with XRE-family HTH domain